MIRSTGRRNSRRSFWKSNRLASREPLDIGGRRLRLEPLEERRLLDAVGVAPDDLLQDDLSSGLSRMAIADHPLQEMFADQADILPEESYEPGKILVKLREPAMLFQSASTAKGEKTMGPLLATESLHGLMTLFGSTAIEPVFPSIDVTGAVEKAAPALAEPNETEVDRAELGRWHRVALPEKTNIKEAVAAFGAVPEVEVAEPNGLWHTADLSNLPDATTDPGYNEQWHHIATNIPESWNYLDDNGVNPGGMRDVIVAVIDTGVDYTHQDLVANMWVNGGEIPDNGVDDDGNGFVDDIHGASVVSDSRSHSGDPMDLHGHGTHVAGIVGSTAFNGFGGVGVAFNTQIMAVRAGQYNGTFAVDDIAEGILYAVDNGAEVINMSFGGYYAHQIVEDALSVAFSQAVLVAAAGNDKEPTESQPNVPDRPHYPAAYPWVLGVMASNQDGKLTSFTNYDPYPNTRYEYEVAAPGTSIYSTLPGNRYGAWSGTSMAAPVVSGVAALLRSFFAERAVYSSRFIMSQIAGTAAGIPRPAWPGDKAPVVDSYVATTEEPTPSVTMLENWIFDDSAIDEGNDGDGRVDAGETIHLGIELINRAGTADQVSATLEARVGAVGSDPYVTIEVGTIDYGSIGPFNTSDNGFIYDQDGVITGAADPFVFSVDPNCPNDHVIPFVLTTTYRNGWDEEDTTVYVRENRFTYVVQRGRDVPNVISEDMELTSDDYWIVGGPVLVEPGATLTIRPGTQVQWGGISDDPYNPGPQGGSILVRGTLLVEGTADNPVSLFPSYLVAGQTTNINVEGGTADLYYTKVRNPNIQRFNTIDHSYFDRDAYSSTISAVSISNTVFHKLPPYGRISAVYGFDTSLFDAGQQSPKQERFDFGARYDQSPRLYNNVFLQLNENNRSIDLSLRLASKPALEAIENVAVYNGNTYGFLTVDYFEASSYVSIFEAEAVANYFGGHVTSIADAAEQAFIESIRPSNSRNHTIGLTEEGHPGVFQWLDGTPVTYTNWLAGEPVPLSEALNINNQQLLNVHFDTWGEWANSRLEVVPPKYIIKLPGEWTTEELNAPIESGEMWDYVRQNYRGYYRWNALLSKYWDVNPNHWMRVSGAADAANGFSSISENFWGTTSTTLIDHAIIDYDDNFTSAHVEYGIPPEHGYETTYPFVESVLINDVPAETAPTVSAGPATFTITFNRDMDASIDPFVTFGPSVPYTDYRVELDGGWTDPRTWQGTHWVTPVTGDGYHQMRISGAVAADDPWLVTGYDVGRFRFQVETMGVAAMTLQATGQEGSIGLNWQQNDYELVAGYNLYRSDSIEGTYERLNGTLIPAVEVSYVDTDITPAVPMYYYFTVVTTDMNESDPSNIAAAAALDTIRPVISHAPATSAAAGYGLRLVAEVTDNVSVAGVDLHYRLTGGPDDYATLAMLNISDNDYSATIPGSAVQAPGVEYYITASDGISTVRDGTPATPHSVVVVDTPSLNSVSPNQGPSEGGTMVTLSGTLFQVGATVEFGGVPAGDVQVLGPNQITCITPPHFPALVEVRVVNPDETEAIRLNGFRYVDEDVVISLPTTSADFGQSVEVPLSVSNVDGLLAAGVTVTFDPAVLTAQSVSTGTLTPGWSLARNLDTPGTVTMSLANDMAVSGSGVLANITFDVVGAPTSQTPLTISNAQLNGGAIVPDPSNGLFTVNGTFTLSGNVDYFGGGPVRGTNLSLVGVGVHADVTDDAGGFTIGDVHTGAYVLTPAKNDDVDQITSFDASLVLQATAGLRNLSANEVLAADVDRSGDVTEMDASYILKKSVGLIDVPFPNTGRVWDFVPQDRSYALINDDLPGQNFTAVLIGDTSANWQPPGGGQKATGRIESAKGTPTLAMAEVVGVTGSRVDVPMRIELAGADVYAADLVLTYDAESLSFVKVASGGAADGMSLAANAAQPGLIRIGLAGAHPLVDDGTLLQISFTVVGSLENPADVSFQSARLNEGAFGVTLDGGAVLAAAEVVGRYVFYNNSTFDGNDPAAGAEDHGAIAPDKQALLPGKTAAMENYTSYDKGINGIMVDIAGSSDPGNLSAADFSFKVGNDSGWEDGPEPLPITVREGGGVNGSDRVTIRWEDNAIKNQWLQVTVGVTRNTGLAQPDIFYFGNAPGEAGNQPINTIVNATDEIVARNFQHSAVDPALIDDKYDYNRDGLVDGTDQIIARENQTNPLTMLRLITAPADAVIEEVAQRDVADPDVLSAALDWLAEFEQVNSKRENRGTAEQAVDMLLATDWQ